VPRLNVGKVLSNPQFTQSFTVYRKSGSWVEGTWVPSEDILNFTGVVTACNPKDLVQVPEGDRIVGLMCFHSTKEMYTTNTNGTSDEIVWNEERYRISSIVPWSDFGYYKAFGVRMVGA
jgi:hypothetical protein